MTAQLPLCYETGVRTRHNESKAGIHTDNLHFPRHNVNWGLPEPGSNRVRQRRPHSSPRALTCAYMAKGAS